MMPCDEGTNVCRLNSRFLPVCVFARALTRHRLPDSRESFLRG